jgi:hypothetical protein
MPSRKQEQPTMTTVNAGVGDRPALAVLAQYRTATTEQMQGVIALHWRFDGRSTAQTGRPGHADVS